MSTRKHLRRYEAAAWLPIIYIIMTILFSFLYTIVIELNRSGITQLNIMGAAIRNEFILIKASLSEIFLLAGASFIAAVINGVLTERYGERLKEFSRNNVKTVLLFDISCYVFALYVVLYIMTLANVASKPVLLNLYFFAVYSGSTYTDDKPFYIFGWADEVPPIKIKKLLANGLGFVILWLYLNMESIDASAMIFTTRNIAETALTFYVGLFCVQISDIIMHLSQYVLTKAGSSRARDGGTE